MRRSRICFSPASKQHSFKGELECCPLLWYCSLLSSVMWHLCLWKESFLPMLAVMMASWCFEMSDFNALLPLWAERGGKLLEMCNATDFQLLPLLQAWYCSLNLFTCFEICAWCNLEFYFPYCNSVYFAVPLHRPVLNCPGCRCFLFIVFSSGIFRAGTSFCFK